VSLVYVGALPLVAICPIVNLSIGEVSVAIQAAFSGALDLNASLSITPPTLTIILAALAQIQAEISAAIALGLPSISFNASFAASLVAKLELAFTLLINLEALLSAHIGIFAYSYSGLANAMGAAVSTELATQWPDGTPSSGASNALIFGAVNNITLTPPTIAPDSMKRFLNGLAFTPGLAYAGKITLATLSLVTALAIDEGNGAIQAQLAAALALQASLAITPPSFAITASALLDYAVALVADAELALPSIQFALDATANLAADLSAKFGLVINLGFALARPDAALFCYKWSGAGNALGGALSTSLVSTWGDGTTPTNTPCIAAILGAVDSLTWTTMGSFFGGV